MSQVFIADRFRYDCEWEQLFSHYKKYLLMKLGKPPIVAVWESRALEHTGRWRHVRAHATATRALVCCTTIPVYESSRYDGKFLRYRIFKYPRSFDLQTRIHKEKLAFRCLAGHTLQIKYLEFSYVRFGEEETKKEKISKTRWLGSNF